MNRKEIKKEDATKLARRYVEEILGLEVVEENYSCKHGGVELIFEEGDDLVFAFVEGRASMPILGESLGAGGREKFEAIASQYLMSHDVANCSVRCDIINMSTQNPEKALLRHHRNALSCAGEQYRDRTAKPKEPLADKRVHQKRPAQPAKSRRSKALER